MGVKGLWQILESVGRPVSLESMENKIIAVDISIWLNQALKGFRDAHGGPLQHAALLGLFHRLCKLLFCKIRPVIVFDGGAPFLKRKTLAVRQQQREEATNKATTTSRQAAARRLLAAQTGGSPTPKSHRKRREEEDDLFQLPPLDPGLERILEPQQTSSAGIWLEDPDKVDIHSEDFLSLPAEIKHEILTALKERHKAWSRLEDLPQESNDFSDFQMKRLLKKRNLQQKIEESEKEMSDIKAQDYFSQLDDEADHFSAVSRRIVSEDDGHVIFIKKLPKVSPKKSDENPSTEKSSVRNTNVYGKPPPLSTVMQRSGGFLTEEDFLFEDAQPTKSSELPGQFKFSGGFLADDDKITAKSAESQVEMQPTTSKKQSDEGELLTESLNETVQGTAPPNSSDVQPAGNSLENASLKDSVPDVILQEREKPNDTLQPICFGETSKISHSKVDYHLVKSPISEPSTSHQHTSIPHISPLNKLTTPLAIPEEDSMPNACSHLDLSEEEEDEDDESLICVEMVGVKQLSNTNNIYTTQISEDLPQSPNSSIPTSLDKEPEIQSEPGKISTESVSQMFDPQQLAECAQTERELRREQAHQERMAATVTDQMYKDCQELLAMFGVPYVLSPMEAEAQCAHLDATGQTQGTITEDSDIWLFGGRRVYRNFFTQGKYVEFFQDTEISRHLGLDRSKMVNLALLTGSDYTPGIDGIGPVTAMEVLSEFSGGDGIRPLTDFRQWWEAAQKDATAPVTSVRAKLRRFMLPANFPDSEVWQAYLGPTVDDSRDSFTWGRPDLDLLRQYGQHKFGWSRDKVDNMIQPILKKYQDPKDQTRIDSFFSVTLQKPERLFPSKRLQSAVGKMAATTTEPPAKQSRKTATTKRQQARGSKSIATRIVRRKPIQPPLVKPFDDESSGSSSSSSSS